MYKLLGKRVDTALALKPLVANANHCEVVIRSHGVEDGCGQA
jgi:hypothetical protein